MVVSVTEMDQRIRAIIRCTECESTYTGWKWPDGRLKIVGKESCPSCDGTEFEVVDIFRTVEIG